MSKIIVTPLESVLTQTFQVSNRVQTAAVRPWLYFQNDPSGAFKIAIKYNGNEIASKQLTMNEIKTLAGWSDNQYHHGFIKFDLFAILNINTDYQIELSADSYSYDPNSYIGWVKPHENLINTFDGVALFDNYKPYGFQIWGYKE